MRLSTLFLLTVGAAALAAIGWVFWRATADTREWNELLSWSGREQAKVSKAEWARFGELVNKRISPREEDLPPWWLLALDGPGGSRRVILFRTRGLVHIPGGCEVRMDVMDERGRVLTRTSASAGWRMEAMGVKGPSRTDLGPWTFEIQSGRSIGGADIARQIYALLDDEPVVIRLENSARMYHRNYYKAPNHTIGPKIPVRTPEEWERSLSSSNPGEILCTLVWLGGGHAPPTPPDPNYYRESLEEAQLLYDTRTRSGVKKRLLELARSPHPWIAEAAAMALAPEDED